MAAGYPMLLILSSLLGRLRSLLRALYARRPNTLGLCTLLRVYVLHLRACQACGTLDPSLHLTQLLPPHLIARPYLLLLHFPLILRLLRFCQIPYLHHRQDQWV
jgi:hypothetical protein